MSNNNKTHLLTAFLSLALITLAVVIAYYPGMKGPFVFDDYFNIVHNQSLAISSLTMANLTDAALSLEIGPLKRPLAMASFALNHYLAGGVVNTFPYKATNLVIHLLNSGLVYWLTLLLMRQLVKHPAFQPTRWHAWVPALTTAVWALHPLHLTSVLYVVQRMNSLSALFVLSGLIVFMYGRLRVQNRQPRGYLLMAMGVVAGTGLGALSKENAVLLPLFIVLIEYIFFFYASEDQPTRRGILLFYALTVLLPGLLGIAWLMTHLDFILAGYAGRDFTLGERLLTQPRVLWFYISLLVLPSTHRLSLFYDDITISSGIFDPWTTFIALTSLILIACAAFKSTRKYPILSFALLWYLAGHALESSFISLEIAHAHRNYLPDIGLIIGGVYGISTLMERYKLNSMATVSFLLIILTLTFSTFSYASIWKDTRTLAMHMVTYRPNSARAHNMLAEDYAKPGEDPIKAMFHYKQAAELNPRETGYLIRLVMVAANTNVEISQNGREIKKSFTQLNIRGLPEDIVIDHRFSLPRLTIKTSTMNRIKNDLSENILLPWTEKVLSGLTKCVTDTKKICQHLYPQTVEWLRAILSNSLSVDRIKQNTYMLLVRLYLEYGQYDLAYQMAKEARAVNPANPELALMEADVLMRLNQLDKAEMIALSLINKSIGTKQNTLKQVNILLEMISTRKNGYHK